MGSVVASAVDSGVERVYERSVEGARVDGVVVVGGGFSAEREVSLRSAERIAAGLAEAGISAAVLDAEPDVLGQLGRHSPGVVWPTLHGASGEDGSLAEVLRLLGVPVVGTGPDGARLAWDKSVAAALAARSGLAVPDAVTVTSDLFRDLGAHRLVEAVHRRLGLPLAVKPKRGGSGFGVGIVTDASDLADAMVAALGHDSAARVERAVAGREVTVTVIDLDGEQWACPAVEIAPVDGGYDFSARYTAGAVEFHVPARVDSDVADRLTEGALSVHRQLGLGSLSRSDWIVDSAGTAWFLEVNTAPGMTETSTAPLGIAGHGPMGTTLAALVSGARALV